MTALLARAALVAALFGCSAAGDAGPEETTPAQPDLVLTPAPGTDVGTLERVAARWSAATGLDVAVAATGGVLVTYVPIATMFETVEVCGVTHSRADAGPLDITISSAPPAGKCRDSEQVLVHEVGHALCDALSGDPGMCHSKHGIMASPSYALGIDESSLAAVCAYAPCTVMVPE
ncbi:MAG: hypothetical protein V4593_08380 [Pseudomonadota bacterium]